MTPTEPDRQLNSEADDELIRFRGKGFTKINLNNRKFRTSVISLISLFIIVVLCLWWCSGAAARKMIAQKQIDEIQREKLVKEIEAMSIQASDEDWSKLQQGVTQSFIHLFAVTLDSDFDAYHPVQFYWCVAYADATSNHSGKAYVIRYEGDGVREHLGDQSTRKVSAEVRLDPRTPESLSMRFINNWSAPIKVDVPETSHAANSP